MLTKLFIGVKIVYTQSACKFYNFSGGDLMKITKILSLVLAVVMMAACFVACGNNDDTPDTADLVGTYDITMKIAVPSNLELDKVTSQIRNLKNVIKINRI